MMEDIKERMEGMINDRSVAKLNNFCFLNITPEDKEEIVKFLADHYISRENTCLGSGSRTCDLHEGYLQDHIKQNLESGLSMMAREEGGKLVGVCLAHFISPPTSLHNQQHHRTTEKEQLNAQKEIQEKGPSCSNASAALYKLDELIEKKLDIYEPGLTNIVLIDQVCVHPQFARQRLAQIMTQMTMESAGKKGCQMFRADITHPYSLTLFTRLRFTIRKTLNVETLQPGLLDVNKMNYKFVNIMTKNI